MRPSCWRKKTATLLITISSALILAATGWSDDKKGGSGVVTDGKQVSLEYTLTLEDQGKVDSNVGKEPLVYTQGAHDIIPGLEKQLAGLKVGETKKIEVSPEEGYGLVKPELKKSQEVPKDKIPPDAHKVGAKLTGQGPGGQPIFAEVTEVKDDIIVLSVDGNHPLAGKKLIFDIKVLKVEDAPAKKVDMPAAAAPDAPTAKPTK
jgi:FKBP-type peptidyl-prolyl cis-trans isomerase SlyD